MENRFFEGLEKIKEICLSLLVGIFFGGITIFSIFSFIISMIFLVETYGDKISGVIDICLKFWKYWTASLGILIGISISLWIVYCFMQWYLPRVREEQEKRRKKFINDLIKSAERKNGANRNRKTAKNR